MLRPFLQIAAVAASFVALAVIVGGVLPDSIPQLYIFGRPTQGLNAAGETVTIPTVHPVGLTAEEKDEINAILEESIETREWSPFEEHVRALCLELAFAEQRHVREQSDALESSISETPSLTPLKDGHQLLADKPEQQETVLRQLVATAEQTGDWSAVDARVLPPEPRDLPPPVRRFHYQDPDFATRYAARLRALSVLLDNADYWFRTAQGLREKGLAPKQIWLFLTDRIFWSTSSGRAREILPSDMWKLTDKERLERNAAHSEEDIRERVNPKRDRAISLAIRYYDALRIRYREMSADRRTLHQEIRRLGLEHHYIEQLRAEVPNRDILDLRIFIHELVVAQFAEIRWRIIEWDEKALTATPETRNLATFPGRHPLHPDIYLGGHRVDINQQRNKLHHHRGTHPLSVIQELDRTYATAIHLGREYLVSVGDAIARNYHGTISETELAFRKEFSAVGLTDEEIHDYFLHIMNRRPPEEDDVLAAIPLHMHRQPLRF